MYNYTGSNSYKFKNAMVILSQPKFWTLLGAPKFYLLTIIYQIRRQLLEENKELEKQIIGEIIKLIIIII